MRKTIAAGALLAILVVAAAPAYAQTNTELLRTIHDTARDIARDMDSMLRSVGSLLDDLRDVLDDISGITPMVERNAESLRNIEAAMMGQACGDGTTPVAGMCVADITQCDADVVDGVCMASIQCGEGTLLHLDTCVADTSISYCGEGTTFRGGVCVADRAAPAPVAEPEPEPEPEPPGATIIGPATADRYVVDGDTIEVTVDDTDATYTLAFSNAPGLTEAGGRAAVQYLDALCGTLPMRMQAEGTPAGLGSRAIIHCGGVDASQAMVVSGHSSFDAADCSVREFVAVPWTQDRCVAAEAGPADAAPPAAPAEPTAPAAPTAPTAPTILGTTPAEPVRGVTAFRDFTFPVTVGDIAQWQTDSHGDPVTTAAISCTFPHTPVEMDVVIADNSAGAFAIDTSPDYTDGNRHGTTMTLTAPTPPRTLFDQQFPVGTGSAVVYDRTVEILNVGAYGGAYSVSMLVTDWDDAAWTGANDPPAPTAAERAQVLYDVDFRILTDITNIDCSMDMAGVAPGVGTAQPAKLLGLAATAPPGAALLDIVPYDVVCREAITITSVSAPVATTFLTGFNTIHVADTESGEDVAVVMDAPPLEGLAFRTSSFTIGDGDSVAPAGRDDVSLGAVALFNVEYTSASDDPCTWTQRTG